jgi:hypothetical protein
MTISAHTTPGTAAHAQAGLVGWGARAGVAAPILALFGVIVGAPLYADDLSDAAASGRFPIAAAAALAALLALGLGLVAAYLAQEHRLGALGRAGFLVALAGTALAAGGAWDSLFTVPYLVEQAPAVLDRPTSGSLLAGYVVSYLVLVAGWALFSVATLRARVLPRAAGIVMLAGALLAVLPMPTPLRVLVLAAGVALAGRALLR